MKPNDETIEAYKKMAKESSGADMKAQIQENLSRTCDKFAGNEDKLVKFKNDKPNYYEYQYEIKRAAAVPNYSGVVAWVRMTEFFKAIEKELGV